MRLTLCRTHQDALCTFGVLDVGGKFCLYTVERGWVHDPANVSHTGLPLGKRNESCIPSGYYDVSRAWSPSVSRNFRYLSSASVHIRRPTPPGKSPHRWGCRFESANRPTDVQGCVGLGLSAKPYGVAESRVALSKFEDALDDARDDSTLFIVNAF